FSSERREEVIQYIYNRYGPEHTGMVCNLVTYRARSAVREVGSALGFPRPLVDRVAKALETYDSVMVRRDLESEGGFAEFFRKPGEGDAADRAGDAARAAAAAAETYGLVDGMGQLNTRLPLVGKVPPWRQPPAPPDPAAPRPFAWLHEQNQAAMPQVTTPVAPNGQIAAPNGQIAVPNGQIAAPNGQIAAPNGQVAVPNGQIAAPNGQIVTQGRQGTWPDAAPSQLDAPQAWNAVEHAPDLPDSDGNAPVQSPSRLPVAIWQGPDAG